MSILISLFVALFLFVSPTLAQSPTPTSRGLLKKDIQQLRPNVIERRDEVKETLETERTEVRTQVKDLRNASHEEIQRRKEEFRTTQEQRKEEFKNRLQEARQKSAEEVERKRTELKERLQRVRDEQKKKIVERVEKHLNELNQRMMKHFSNVLDHLEKVLVNIKSRTDKAEAKGWNVSTVRAMITAAEEAIGRARAAVEAQAAKTYTPEVSGEEGKLKVEVGQARQALHKDLATVREKVRIAFEAVRRVATTLAQVPRIDHDATPSPTHSPTPTPSLTVSPTPTTSPTPTPTPTPSPTP